MTYETEGEVTVERDGQKYTGHWKLMPGESLRVSHTTLGSKDAQLRNSKPNGLAQIMLGELVQDAQRRKS